MAFIILTDRESDEQFTVETTTSDYTEARDMCGGIWRLANTSIPEKWVSDIGEIAYRRKQI
jgi:hypothetical protein